MYETSFVIFLNGNTIINIWEKTLMLSLRLAWVLMAQCGLTEAHNLILNNIKFLSMLLLSRSYEAHST